MEEKKKIFFIHAFKDRNNVIKYYQKLKILGFDTVIAPDDVPAGMNWLKWILHQIQQTKYAGYVLFFCSSNSYNRHGVLQDELEQALKNLDYIGDYVPHLITLKLDKSPLPKIKSISKLQAIELYKTGGYSKLVHVLITERKTLNPYIDPNSSNFDLDSCDETTQRVLLEDWKQLIAIPGNMPPQKSVIPIEEQKKIQNNSPIDFKPINQLITFLSLDCHLKIPCNNDEYSMIKPQLDKLCKQLWEFVNYKYPTLNSKEKDKFDNICNLVFDSLSAEDKTPNLKLDFLFVPGARTLLRVDKAGELYLNGFSEFIFLSGTTAKYSNESKEEISSITEAEAMQIHLTTDELTRENIPLTAIIRDKRGEAYDTYDNVKTMKKELKKRKQADRPLSIGIVTSPYHLLRTYLMFLKFKQDDSIPSYRKYINEIYRFASKSKYTKVTWLQSDAGIRTVLSEWWKIHGGRLVGEF